VETDQDFDALIREVTGLREHVISEPVRQEHRLRDVHANFRDSARNLLHYLALRRHDLRPLQLRLAALGLSSLGRAEPNVLATLDAVLKALHGLARRPWLAPPDAGTVAFTAGQRLLADHTEALLGATTPGRDVRIMVTMPTEAANDYTLVHDLLAHGMDCMRINCAHDDAPTWTLMIEHLERAKRALGRECRIVMDLGGPKLRTGPIAPGPAVVRIRPYRDVYGRVSAPARVWLTHALTPRPPPAAADACLPVEGPWLARVKAGERIKFTDARAARRTLTIVDSTPDGCWAETAQTAYVVQGVELRRGREAARGQERSTHVGALPPTENVLLLDKGDLLVLTRQPDMGRPATRDSAGRILTPATIACTIPEVFDEVRSGEPIWLDDGRIGGVIERVERDRILVRIKRVRPGGAKLRADKGINLPESHLRLSALTQSDLDDLSFVAEHADVVELSFASSAHDVEGLQHELAKRGRHHPIVLKIETRRGFENLPEMLLTAMRAPCCGVMIARGDLAVESGFERLAEIQEETLWICEAAHVPVIWATQVLETLAREGMPSRAEITDAAMGHRAECVMLNKGPYIVTAVQVLDDILRRMQAHQAKKRSMLRRLELADKLPVEAESAGRETASPLT
jgi:pyruvate kinase